ncbi:MAG TPA: DUF2752 domain-containing protein [Phycisphaerales bacterium]|nr:DUF2752 domain-containing protein [Phycisphaerales bacterium]
MTHAPAQAQPLPASRANRASGGERVVASLVAAACLAVLVIAAGLTPAGEGSGTHTQLGMPSCGWAVSYGAPCPTCGMTTAFAHAAHLSLWQSFKTQPMGFLLAVGTAAGFWVALYVAATGSLLGRLCGRLLAPRMLWVLLGIAAASWAYKWVVWES